MIVYNIQIHYQPSEDYLWSLRPQPHIVSDCTAVSVAIRFYGVELLTL